MGNLGSSIIIKKETRPCFADGKKAMFHQWTNESEIVPPSIMRGGHSGGVISTTLAIVEYEDGTVHKTFPEKVRFADGGEFAETAFLDKEAEQE